MKEGKKELWTLLVEKLAKLLDPQFLLGAFILIAWIIILQQPLKMLKNINLDDVSKAKEQIGMLLNLTAGLGALFTTALGFVLGHFFGKQGIESADERTSSALKEKEVAETAKREKQRLAGETIPMIERDKKNIVAFRAEVAALKKEYEKEYEGLIKIATKFKEAEVEGELNV